MGDHKEPKVTKYFINCIFAYFKTGCKRFMIIRVRELNDNHWLIRLLSIKKLLWNFFLHFSANYAWYINYFFHKHKMLISYDKFFEKFSFHIQSDGFLCVSNKLWFLYILLNISSGFHWCACLIGCLILMESKEVCFIKHNFFSQRNQEKFIFKHKKMNIGST